MFDFVLAVFGAIGLGGIVWALRAFWRLRAAPAVLPPPPMPNPEVVREAAAELQRVTARAEKELVGPPTILGASESEARLAAFEKSLDSKGN